MAGDTEDEIPETGAVFTFGKSKFADNVPSKFWLKNDVPLKLACGDEHTALITENGKLFMFGSNNWGQLGLGEKISVNKPTCVKALKAEKVKLVACGRTHTLVYTSCGNLYAAGGNNDGQLGLGDFEERTSFQLVEFFTKSEPIKMLAAGSNTSAAITQDGKLYVWGDNTEGQIGLGKEEGTSTPRELHIGRRVMWISCGYYHSAFVTEDGALFTFGERDSGKLGLSTAQVPNHKVPQQVEGICEKVLQVACGGGHTLALTEKYLYSFGLGQFGQLGHGTFTFESSVPRVVEHFRKGRVKHIACGENHSAVLTESGFLYTFGDGRHGKLALGEEYFANQFKPTLCPRFLNNNVQAVTCGGCHMLVLAKPRHRRSEDVILEDDDVTEDHLQKLLREAESRHSLNRNLSARDRRRERFGVMFQTLPPLSSGHLNMSLPASSQTLPSQLNKRTMNGFQRNGLLSSTGKVKEEHEVCRKTPVKNYEDNESVKDLGETTDLLNLTHVMKLDPGEKTITLSPVQKISNHKTMEFSDDETTGDEEQTEDEEDEENDDLEQEIDEEEQCEKDESKEDPMKQTNQQEICVIQPTPQVKNDVEEATVHDEQVKDSQDKGSSCPLTEKKLDQSEAKQERPKRLFGSNSKISLFKRQSFTQKEKAKAPVEERSPAEKAISSDSGDVGQSHSAEASDSRRLRSRSATCTLL
ncbi:retinitis pigmentosa GTPase regulator b [Clarias gariepinus]|uniref:retinitis pigmentosa GTPase regulator b n=1 Tax=Clarias gariepinus TaxID=13013 RepID=UPI00234DF377|nr:retinitis pigmentosa GTPase regulator b [Clarias gariepinus]